MPYLLTWYSTYCMYCCAAYLWLAQWTTSIFLGAMSSSKRLAIPFLFPRFTAAPGKMRHFMKIVWEKLANHSSSLLQFFQVEERKLANVAIKHSAIEFLSKTFQKYILLTINNESNYVGLDCSPGTIIFKTLFHYAILLLCSLVITQWNQPIKMGNNPERNCW